MKWTILSLLLIGNAFGDFSQMISAAKNPPTKTADQAPPGQEADANLFRPNDQVYSTHVEFLYWKAFATDLMFAQQMTGPSYISGFSANPMRIFKTKNDILPAGVAAMGNYKNSQFNIDPGFRISQSFFRASRLWEIWGSYTRLTSRGKNSISAPDSTTNLLISAWALPTMDTLKHAKSSLHLNYNVADFYADRYFNPNPHLRIRMIAGLTGTWLAQNWTIKYFDILNQTTRLRNAWNYWGCGIRFGMTGDWYWTHDFYLTVRGTLAGLMGPYHNRTLQTTTAIGPRFNSTLPIRKASYRDTRPVGNIQLLVGPSWQKNWNKTRTELFVGYEFNAWMNLQEVYHSTISEVSNGAIETWINSGWIGLQGLTSRFSIDY